MAGAGKSTLRDIFKSGGAFAVNLDEVGHGFYSDAGSEVYKSVLAEFGDKVSGLLTGGGAIDRKKLGGHVFADRAALNKLNSIFYNEFNLYVKNLLNEIAGSGREFFVLDAAVLFDSGLDALMDYNIWVSAAAGVLIQRLAAGRGVGADYAERIVKTQLEAYKGYSARADFIIDNGGGPELLEAEYHRIIKEIRGNVKN
jgi:dephospho-CoA kinase